MTNTSSSNNIIYNPIKATYLYYKGLYDYIILKKSYNNNSNDEINNNIWAKVQIYSLSIIFKIFNKKHYRTDTFQQDMINNLCNVAVPGTGIPLHIFCYNYYILLLYILICNPLISFYGAINKAIKLTNNDTFINNVIKYYNQHLLYPDDWFSLWRLNCRLISLHSLLTKSLEYNYEDKWTFLQKGNELGLRVTPYLTNIDTLVCKNKNIEGGMGIYFYKNAINNGDWILQEKLNNSIWLNKMLPSNAPLSTMRIITTSKWSLQNIIINDTPCITTLEEAYKYIKVESGVLRLGRKNASTDHSSVLFDVDIHNNGIIKEGTSNAHWYQLGITNILTCPWLPPSDGFTHHPDDPKPRITGQSIPDINNALNVVVESHFKMMPNIPIIGWDVAFTTEGVYLLEVNLSCNFFKGSFDIHNYIKFVDNYWKYLSNLESDGKVTM